MIEAGSLPATSQVAQQQGKYFGKALTRRARKLSVEPFRYNHLGMLAYVGANRALADLETYKGRGWPCGFSGALRTFPESSASRTTCWSCSIGSKRRFGRDINQF